MESKLLQKVDQTDHEQLSAKFDDICAVISNRKLILQTYLLTNPSLSTFQTNKILKILNRTEFFDIPEAVLLNTFSYLSHKDISSCAIISKYINGICLYAKPSFLSLIDIVRMEFDGRKTYLLSHINKFTKIHKFYIDIHAKIICEKQIDLSFVNKLFSEHLPYLTHINTLPLDVNDDEWYWNEQDIEIQFQMENYPNLLVFDCMTYWNYSFIPPKLHTLSANSIKYEYLSLVNQVECAKLNRGHFYDEIDSYTDDDGYLHIAHALNYNDKNKLKCLMDSGANEVSGTGDFNAILLINNRDSLTTIHIDNMFMLQPYFTKPITLPRLKNICLTTFFVKDIGDRLNTPNVITMAWDRPCYRSNFVNTLHKLKIAQLRFLILKGWSWHHIVRILITDYDRLEHCIEFPFCIELRDVSDAHGDCLRKERVSTQLRKNALLNKKIIIKHENDILFCDNVSSPSNDEIWSLYKEENELKCHFCGC